MVFSRFASRLMALVGVMAVTALSGCASTVSADPTPTSTAAVESTSAPSSAVPTPTAVPSPTADPSGISASGIGQYQLGGSYGQARALLGLPAAESVARCPWFASVGDPDTLMTNVIAGTTDGVTATNEIVSIAIQGNGTAEGSPRTDRGIGLGSTPEEVLSAYPDAASEDVLYADSALRVIAGESATVVQFRAGAAYMITLLAATESIPGEYCG